MSESAFFKWAGFYQTGVKWGGASGSWHPEAELFISPTGRVTYAKTVINNPTWNGDTLTWPAEGNPNQARISFSVGNDNAYFWSPGVKGINFTGGFQSGSGGWVDFRGLPTLATWAGFYLTAVKWGGTGGQWHDQGPLVISPRGQVTLGHTPIHNATFWDGQLSWKAEDKNPSNATVRFQRGCAEPYFFQPPTDHNVFTGSSQSGGDGPVDYRGLAERLFSPQEMEDAAVATM